jgi:hypothetical protein
MIAPAFGWVSVGVSVCCVMAADCRFLACRQGKNLGFGAELGCKPSYGRSRQLNLRRPSALPRETFQGQF